MRWFRRGRVTPPPERWALSDTVMRLSSGDALTLEDFAKGVLIIGSTGSGKTSGPGQACIQSLMVYGCGCLCLTAKPGDAQKLIAMARRAGREGDVVHVYPGGPYRYDALAWAMQERPGSTSDDAARTLELLSEMMTRSEGGGKGDNAFFHAASSKAIRNGLTLLRLSYGGATILGLYKLIVEAPTSAAELARQREGVNPSLLAKALDRAAGNEHDIAIVTAFWESEWIQMGDRTRGAVIATITNTLAPFLPSAIYDLVGTPEATVSPDMPLQGKIVIVDVPPLVYKDSGRLVQAMLKVQTQWEVLRRPVTPGMRPVCVVCDEAHLHALPDNDTNVQTVCRESKLINMVLVQSLQVIATAFGGSDKRAHVEAWVANLSCKFICANSCNDTNLYFSRLFGKRIKYQWSGGGSEPYDLLNDVMGTAKPANINWRSGWEEEVRPEEFGQLSPGGVQNNLLVSCYLFLAGKRLRNGKAFSLVWFKQG